MTCRLAVLVCDRLQTHVYDCVRRSRESVVTVSLTVLACAVAHVSALQRSKEPGLLEVLAFLDFACTLGACGHEVIVHMRLLTHVC